MTADKNNPPTGVTGTHRDATTESHEILPQNTMDYLREGCQIIGRDWTYLYVNDAAAKHGRTTKDQLIGRTMMDAYPGIDQTEMFQLLRECMDNRAIRKFENQFTYSDGAVAWFELRFEPVPAGVFILSSEITERKTTEEQLRLAQRMESVGRLAGGIAHDFNNLLTVILNCADFALRGLDESERRHRDIVEISNAAGRAASLTRQLLAFSRRQVLRPRVVSLNEIVENMSGMLRRLIGEDVVVKFQLAEDPGMTMIDPGQIEQVIMNLVINARDAMPGGGWVRIETANVELDEAYADRHLSVTPGPHVMLSVSDSGFGMDAETKSHIFEPFFTTKDAGKGTGLGLATVFGIVKQSQGSIWVYSEPGEGTVFKIFFPRTVSEADALAPKSSAASHRASGESILLVEDDDAVRRTAERILQDAGYCIVSVESGMEAIRIMREDPEKFDLVVTDVVMPKMKGQELAQVLRTIRPDVRLMFMSGYSDESASLTGITASGIPLIGKPFSAADLTSAVRDALKS